MRQESARTAPQGRERTPGQVEEAIIDMTLLGYTPTQIRRELPQVAAEKGLKAPSLRTIQRIARRPKPPDPTGQWQIDDLPADDARIVLDFLAELISASEGRVTYVTRGEAPWIARPGG